MSKIADHMFLNVIDTRFGLEKALKRTILFRHGSFNSTVIVAGFTYCWNIDDIDCSGSSIVVNPAYESKSEEEICLMCAIESPVTREDVQKYIDSYEHLISQKLKDTLWKIFEETTR